MEESFETFEEELGSARAEPPPRKPVRQVRRPEMYAARRVRQETAPLPQQPGPESRALPREQSFTRTMSLQKPLSTQNQTETPWENVTLNRCLFVAIMILVLSSGCQKLHETLRGQRTAEVEEEAGLTVRRSEALRHRGHPAEPVTTLWEVMFWWLPDLDDDNEGKKGKSKRGATSGGLRNRPLLDKKLLKQRGGKLKSRRSKKDKENKGKKERGNTEEPSQMLDDEDEENEETLPKNKKLNKHKENTQK
ncbi:junctional sarcoplasmic reticulum protein 1 [Antennarius striatus]|uniref:junctional sarcoplasmic reticulum protein 1 n=1 Tax=Antennarius striatus TaxID=241820 RepID=UPI0035B1C231